MLPHDSKQQCPAPLNNRDIAVLWAIELAVVIALQFAWNAQNSEFWHTDDGSHYVSSAMIASWLHSGFVAPLSFALDYQAHYPLVGIGLWGPAFYGVFGGGIALFGAPVG